jgi:acyl carrier protein
MSDAQAIERLIARFITEELVDHLDAGIGLDENLLTDGYLDSVGVMRLIAYIESSLRVTIPPPELIPQNFRTIRVMAAYLAGRGAAPAAPGSDASR